MIALLLTFAGLYCKMQYMRIVTEKQLKQWALQHPKAASWLAAWTEVVKHADWRTLTEVRRTYSHADAFSVGSGKTVTVFNVKGNDYRLVTAIHYGSGIVFALKLLTHAEYSKDRWKGSL